MIRCLVLGLALAAAVPALAADSKPKAPFSGVNPDLPIKVACDSQVYDWTAETFTCDGARIEQGTMVLKAAKVFAEGAKGKTNRITASGDVVITSEDATATAPQAVYDIVASTLHMTGDVTLTQGENTLQGTDLLVDMTAGTATLTGKGSASGRVEGILQPGSVKSEKKPK